MKVISLINATYQVVNEEDYYEVYFQGSLSDCEAYIRLTEKGYM